MLDEPGGDYWATLEAFIHRQLLAKGLISPEDLQLFKRTDRVEEAVAEVLGFFRIYHSMRYVHGKLVLRLNRRPGPAAQKKPSRRSSPTSLPRGVRDLRTVAGRAEEIALAALPRLTFQYNRYNQGRLRQLIDYLNGIVDADLMRRKRPRRPRASGKHATQDMVASAAWAACLHAAVEKSRNSRKSAAGRG